MPELLAALDAFLQEHRGPRPRAAEPDSSRPLVVALDLGAMSVRL